MSRLSACVVAASALTLMACGQGATETQPAEAVTTASADLPAECESHPLLVAMPERTPLGGKAFSSISCQPFSVEMAWGEPGSSSKIILVDSQAEVEDDGVMAGMAEMARTMPYQAAVMAIQMTEGVHEMARAAPAALAEMGGPDFLPVVKEANGLRYTIEVEAKDSGGRVGSLIGTAKDRYALTLLIEHDTLVGLAAGEAAYAPYLSAMKLNQLP